MFTGIIKELGHLVERSEGRLVIKAPRAADSVHLGDSLAINGVCLTASAIDPPLISMDLLEETLRRTNLGATKPDGRLNIEPSLEIGEQLGGHFVTGHIDGTGRLAGIGREGRDWVFQVELPDGCRLAVVEKGSIALDGISLTVADLDENIITVHVIPHTYSNTNLQWRKEGDLINIETDLLGKYVLRYLELKNEKKSKISRDFLRETGFL